MKEIKSHWGKGVSAWFEVKDFSNEVSWEPYAAIRHLTALQGYFQDLGIDKIYKLPSGSGSPRPSLQLQIVELGKATGKQTDILSSLACFRPLH